MPLGDDRRETGKTSAESEELYRLLTENSTDMISKHTPEGVYTPTPRPPAAICSATSPKSLSAAPSTRSSIPKT